jgi:hypothetical protein
MHRTPPLHLIGLDERQWPSAIASHTIKQVYLMREMCFIPLAIGPKDPCPRLEERWFRPDGTPRRHPFFGSYSSDGRRGPLGSLLVDRIYKHVKKMDASETAEAACVDDDPWLIVEDSFSEGFGGFHLLWDHNKHNMKKYCLGRPWSRQKHLREPTEEEYEYERQHQWADSSDEEGEM